MAESLDATFPRCLYLSVLQSISQHASRHCLPEDHSKNDALRLAKVLAHLARHDSPSEPPPRNHNIKIIYEDGDP